MGNYGIKVTTDGSDVGTADPRTISMSSKYTMFKIHSDGTQTGTIQTGKTAGTLTFTHGLGYVPAFWTYYVDIEGKQRQLSNLPEGIGYTGNIVSYAGTNTITCIYDRGPGTNTIGPLYWTSAYETQFGLDDMQVGQDAGVNIDCATRFGSVTVAQGATIGTATLNFYINAKGTTTADGTLRYFGIDVDNLNSVSNMGDPETTAGGTQNVANINVGEYFYIDVTSAAQEIVNRPGWSSGNGMGFHILNVNFPNEKWYYDNVNKSNLVISLPDTSSDAFSFRVVIFKDKIY